MSAKFKKKIWIKIKTFSKLYFLYIQKNWKHWFKSKINLYLHIVLIWEITLNFSKKIYWIFCERDIDQSCNMIWEYFSKFNENWDIGPKFFELIEIIK